MFSWARADSRVESGGKVTQFTDKVFLPAGGGAAGNARSVDPSHAFAQATALNQPAASAVDAGFPVPQLSSVFGGQAYLDSTIAAANWAFCQDGSGCLRVHVFVPTAAASNSIVFATIQTSANGVQDALIAGSGLVSTLFNAGGSIAAPQTGSGTIVNGTGAYVSSSYSEALSPKYDLHLKAPSVSSGSPSGAPVAGAPSATACLGGRGDRAVPFLGNWAESLFYKGNNVASVLANVQKYLSLRYGL